MTDLWITMAGPAGVGKSTLATMLAAALRADGVGVVVLGEDELFTRHEFVDVADGFRTGRSASPQTFEAAYAAWLGGLGREAVAILDWNPAGMAGDLPWGLGAERPDYLAHLAAVRRLARERIIVLDLQAPAAIAIRRAAEERGADWLRRYDQIAQAAGHQHPDQQQRIIAWTEDHIARTRAELDVAAAAGWPIHVIDAASSPEQVLGRALTAIRGWPRVVDETVQAQLRVIHHVVRVLSGADIPVWLFGGWGLDARIGQITRRHGDVEFWMRRSDSTRSEAILVDAGSTVMTTQPPEESCEFSWDGVTFSTAYFDRRADGTFAPQGRWADWLFPPDSFEGVPGSLDGIAVPAMSVAGMLAMKEQFPTLRNGGPWREKDVADVAVLRRLQSSSLIEYGAD